MTTKLEYSIIISSYNKMHLVGATVDSALSQSCSDGEVIVVDDGSTDDSIRVLEAYGNRIRLVAKENGGQASAMNAGFLISSGKIVFFLDCDDLLMPDTVERVARQWSDHLSKTHFRLQMIKEDGTPVAGALLPPYGELPKGDLSQMLECFGFYPSPPTSGNAYSRRMLERVIPIPEDIYRAWPDTLLIGLAPLFGQIGALSGIGGYWRQFPGNYSTGGLDKLRAKLDADDEYIRLANQYASSGMMLPRNMTARWPQHLKDQLIVKKFSPRHSSVPTGLVACCFLYLSTIARWPEYRIYRRLLFCVWGIVMLVVPARLLKNIPGIAGPYISLPE